jgi:hypothetical protein
VFFSAIPSALPMKMPQAELAAAKKEIEMLKMRQELEAARAEIARMKAAH